MRVPSGNEIFREGGAEYADKSPEPAMESKRDCNRYGSDWRHRIAYFMQPGSRSLFGRYVVV
jgi:hypothetical protein